MLNFLSSLSSNGIMGGNSSTDSNSSHSSRSSSLSDLDTAGRANPTTQQSPPPPPPLPKPSHHYRPSFILDPQGNPVAIVEKFKAKGNEFYKKSQTTAAIAEYTRGLGCFETFAPIPVSSSTQGKPSSSGIPTVRSFNLSQAFNTGNNRSSSSVNRSSQDSLRNSITTSSSSSTNNNGRPSSPSLQRRPQTPTSPRSEKRSSWSLSGVGQSSPKLNGKRTSLNILLGTKENTSTNDGSSLSSSSPSISPNERDEAPIINKRTSSVPITDADDTASVRSAVTLGEDQGSQPQQSHTPICSPVVPLAEDDPLNLLAQLLSNRAVAYIHDKKPELAYLDAGEVVRLRPDWVKGYYRRAEALMGMRRYELALSDFKAALERDKGNKVIMERIARVTIHQKDASMGLVLHQLLPGRDICSKSFLAPIQNLIFDFAVQMRNYIYFVGNAASREVMIVDACWDVDGLIKFAKNENLKIVGAIITHYHIDHAGGIPPPPYDKWGVRVDGIAKLLKRIPHIKAYVNPHDIEEIVKANPEIPRDRLHATYDEEVITLPMSHSSHRAIPTDVPPPSIAPPVISPTMTLPPDLSVTPWERESLDHSDDDHRSQCILINGERLLSGDTLFIGSCGRVDFPDSSARLLSESLERISRMPDSVVVLPGHAYGGEFTTVRNERSLGLLNPKARREFLREIERLQEAQRGKGEGAGAGEFPKSAMQSRSG
ncbi:hypothetical protein HDU76_009022 [Blyttiomyces sp. JEL0837]|nr:hypothetical protein HDU76_009022 [Blyttiomyces sp. JEL0837]